MNVPSEEPAVNRSPMELPAGPAGKRSSASRSNVLIVGLAVLAWLILGAGWVILSRLDDKAITRLIEGPGSAPRVSTAANGLTTYRFSHFTCTLPRGWRMDPGTLKSERDFESAGFENSTGLLADVEIEVAGPSIPEDPENGDWAGLARSSNATGFTQGTGVLAGRPAYVCHYRVMPKKYRIPVDINAWCATEGKWKITVTAFTRSRQGELEARQVVSSLSIRP
jgi:hypothetical protein